MCLILLASRAHPRYPLVVAANRDEFHDRPTAAASFWEGAPDVLAGRDLLQGGTWLGVTRRGRLGAVTNLRDGRPYRGDAPSRGALVTDFLLRNDPAQRFLEDVRGRGEQFNGFNLLLGNLAELYLYSTGNGEVVRLPAGIHGVSNHAPGGAWPKTLHGKALLERVLSAPFSDEDLLAILADETVLPPDVIGLQAGTASSPVFIRGSSFGTRSSTVLLVGADGRSTFAERTFDRDGETVCTARFCFTIAA